MPQSFQRISVESILRNVRVHKTKEQDSLQPQRIREKYTVGYVVFCLLFYQCEVRIGLYEYLRLHGQ
jgi:hypothetical protein